MAVTAYEKLCLLCLSNKMEATASMVGEYIATKVPGKENCNAVAAYYLGSLKQKGFVGRVPELHAWQITPTGRKQLTKAENQGVLSESGLQEILAQINEGAGASFSKAEKIQSSNAKARGRDVS